MACALAVERFETVEVVGLFALSFGRFASLTILASVLSRFASSSVCRRGSEFGGVSLAGRTGKKMWSVFLSRKYGDEDGAIGKHNAWMHEWMDMQIDITSGDGDHMSK